MEIGELQPSSESSPESPSVQPSGAFRWPAAYYSNPAGEVAPLFPKWVPVGCGSVAAVALAVLFAGGAIAMSGGAAGGGLLDTLLGVVQGEITPLVGKEATAAQRAAFQQSMNELRARARAGKVDLPKLQKMLEAMQSALSDQHVTPEELDGLTRTARDLAAPKAQPAIKK